MKTSQFGSGKILIIAIACSLALGTTTQAGANGNASMDNANLVVHRAADFGTLIYLNLYIDGVQVTTLGLNERYEAIVRPGPHVLSIGTSPSPYGHTKFTYRRVHIHRGQSYAFTALWEGADQATLETWDGARHSRMVW
jgi:hypothetical protein